MSKLSFASLAVYLIVVSTLVADVYLLYQSCQLLSSPPCQAATHPRGFFATLLVVTIVVGLKLIAGELNPKKVAS